MNTNLLALQQHPSKSIADRLSGDPETIDLTNGQPNFQAPDSLLERMAALMSEDRTNGTQLCNHYAPARGDGALRTAVAGYYDARYGVTLDPAEHILITNGAAEALWLAIMTLTNPGEEVILFEPSYSLYDRIASALGCRPVWVPREDLLGSTIDFEALSSLISSRTGAIVVNSPINPSGAVIAGNDLLRLAEVAKAANCTMIFDEVFDTTIFHGEHQSLAGHSHVCTVNSFSKRFNMMGWRLGWLTAPANIVAQATKLHTLICLGCHSGTQRAAVPLLNEPRSNAENFKNREQLRTLAEQAFEAVKAIEGLCPGQRPPEAGFYLFVRCDELATQLAGRYAAGLHADEIVATHFERECKVAVVPGRAFGPRADNFIRLSFASNRQCVTEACERLKASI